MRREDLLLDRKTRRLVAEQLRDQRQIEPLACLRGAVDQFGDQAVPQRTKIDAADRHFVSLARPIRSAQRAGPRPMLAATPLPSHAASVASTGAANCDEISPWKTDGPT